MLFLLPAFAGLLLVTSFPRADLGYLAWIAFIPLVDFVLRAGSVQKAFAGGLVAGFVEFFPLLIWMPPVLTRYGGLPLPLAWIAYGLLVCVLACYPAAACALAKYLVRRHGDMQVLLFPAVWVVFEYAQSLSPFGGFPWTLAGYSQSRFPGVIQIADVTGVYGISFLLVWTGVAALWLVREKGRGLRAWAPAGAAIALIAGNLIYGVVSMRNWGAMRPRYTAALLQGNISFDDPEPVLLDKFQDGYVRMADRLKPGVDLLILPESPSPVNFESDARYRQMLEKLAGRFPFGLIFNNISDRGTGDNARYFNSAYFLDRNGSLTGVYDKIHLVPFGEYLPLEKFLPFLETISKDVSAFSPGDDYKVIRIGNHPVNAIICFEAVFPRLVRRFVRQGSQLMVNLTNDAWYGDSAAPYQHLAISRLRAVETRRYLLRAANSGISAFIGPDGTIRGSTGILQETICEGRFDFIAAESVYARYGDVFVMLCAIICCGSLIWPLGAPESRRQRRGSG
jgi:apolipoprotein N-acyltransferase